MNYFVISSFQRCFTYQVINCFPVFHFAQSHQYWQGILPKITDHFSYMIQLLLISDFCPFFLAPGQKLLIIDGRIINGIKKILCIIKHHPKRRIGISRC